MAEIVAGRSQLFADQQRHIGDRLDSGTSVAAQHRDMPAFIVAAGHALVAIEHLEALGWQEVQRAVHDLAWCDHDVAGAGARETAGLVEGKSPAVEPARDALARGNTLGPKPFLE